MKEFWDERFGKEEYKYGKTANTYLVNELSKINYSGKILLPAEGEGRNATFCALNNWDVSAFDISSKGKEKAFKLAKEYDVSFKYNLGEFVKDYNYEDNSFDALALIYAHFPSSIRSRFNQELSKKLKIGGKVILEGFSLKQAILQEGKQSTNGPKDPTMLFSKEEILNDFKNFEILHLEEEKIELNAGKNGHQGFGYVIRFTGKRIK